MHEKYWYQRHKTGEYKTNCHGMFQHLLIKQRRRSERTNIRNETAQRKRGSDEQGCWSVTRFNIPETDLDGLTFIGRQME